jgi:hypothetical protein
VKERDERRASRCHAPYVRTFLGKKPPGSQHESSFEKYALAMGAREMWRRVRSGLVSVWCHSLLGPRGQE